MITNSIVAMALLSAQLLLLDLPFVLYAGKWQLGHTVWLLYCSFNVAPGPPPPSLAVEGRKQRLLQMSHN